MAFSAVMKRMLQLFVALWVALLIYLFSVHREKLGNEEKEHPPKAVALRQLRLAPGTAPTCGSCQRQSGEGPRCCWEVRGSRLRAVFTDRPRPQWEAFEVLATADAGAAELPVAAYPLFDLLPASAHGKRHKELEEGHYGCGLLSIAQSSQISLRLQLSCAGGIFAEFSAELAHEDSHYMRFSVRISHSGQGWPSSGYRALRLWRLRGSTHVVETRSEHTDPDEEEFETINGLPLLVNKRFFVAVEHPMGASAAEKQVGVQWLNAAGQIAHLQSLTKPTEEVPWHYGFVLGAFDEESQARRSFLAYLHRERPGRRSPMVHYNSWYDFYSYQDEGFNGGFKDPYPNKTLIAMLRPDKLDEGGCLRRVEAFGREMVEKRGTKLDSFLWDDGWDDPHTLWEFDKERFPQRFDEVAAKARSFGAGTGVWLSPWGGYGFPQEARVKYGKEQGYETNYNRNIQSEAFSLAGEKYRKAFHETAMKFRREQGVNMFKFDGVAGDPTELAMEMEAMLRTIASLRNKKGKDDEDDVWINLTTGTWPSPFFLFWADSIWRGGPDIPTRPQDWYGPVSVRSRLRGEKVSTDRVGVDGLTGRQRWIRWRSLVVYLLVVRRSTFFPISQLMIHGVIVGSHGDALHWGLDKFDEVDFTQEVWSFVAMGLQLQELYVAPRHMTPKAWDILAEGLRWSRGEASVLRDSHWAFGNLARYHVYCIASWDVASARGFMFLHNPTGFSLGSESFTLEQVLELPAAQRGQALTVALVKSAFRPPQAFAEEAERLPGWECAASFTEPPFGNVSSVTSCRLNASRQVQVTLKPTEVLVLSVSCETCGVKLPASP